MSHFYLTLPSNSSFDYYPNNTAAHYFTKLPKDVSLDGEWEVGLAEIDFPHSWFNVPKPQTISTFHTSRISTPTRGDSEPASQVVALSPPAAFTVVVAEGYYPTIADLVAEINRALLTTYTTPRNGVQKRDRPIFTYNEHSRKTYIRLANRSYLRIPTRLCNLLGFAENSTDNEHLAMNMNLTDRKMIKGQNISDIDYGLHSLYVYCDVLEYTPVGDTMAPLLRIVDVDGEHGRTIHKHYDNPRYVPVQKRNFSSLEIDIRTNTGEVVPFESGPLVVTLHFRRARNSYFT